MTRSGGAPHTVAASWPERTPGRLAALLRTEPGGCRAALLGLPDDLGVKLNGGRTGARSGPAALRAVLARFGVGWDGLRGEPLACPIYDAGDVEPAAGGDAEALLETHRRVEAAVLWLQQQGVVTICVGGGHDLSLPSVRAASLAAGCALGGINLDAHLDVRARIGSGMPFRKLIEGGQLDAHRFTELGLGRFSNDPGDLAWLREQGGSTVFAETILDAGLDVESALQRACGAGRAFLSIDLDALDQSVAPGVSAPNPWGLGVSHAARLAEAAGASSRVVHFDVMELNPEHDVGARTARAAALLLLYFVSGLGRRP